LQRPPATFYSWITATAGFTPTLGMSVTASINGNVCGASAVQQDGQGRLYYVLQVQSENGFGEPNGCGQLGQMVRFRVGSWVMNQDRLWNNSLAWFHSLDVPMEPVQGWTAVNNSPTALGTATQFTATISAGDAVSFTWGFGDGSPVAAGQYVAHQYAGVGVYTAVVTVTNSFDTLNKTTVVVVQEGIGGLTAWNNGPVQVGQAALFSATISSGTAVSYTWEFGDGSADDGQIATHMYQSPGIYTATVTARNLVGQLSAAIQIEIQSQGYKIYLPSLMNGPGTSESSSTS